MKPRTPQTRLQEQQQSLELSQTEQKQVGRQFESVEEMLRHDIAQTAPPQTIIKRLKDSLAKESQSARSWWRKLFS